MRVGDRIMRKSSLEGGYILAAQKLPSGCCMVQVRWDLSGIVQRVPSEEIRPWDKLQSPPPIETTSWGRTTPRYLVNLRHSLPRNSQKNPAKGKKLEAQLADDLIHLANKRKHGCKQKANNLIVKFEGNTPKFTKPVWNYAVTDAEMERRKMKELYQKKSGDHSY